VLINICNLDHRIGHSKTPNLKICKYVSTPNICLRTKHAVQQLGLRESLQSYVNPVGLKVRLMFNTVLFALLAIVFSSLKASTICTRASGSSKPMAA
jgi:hypothetical protein